MDCSEFDLDCCFRQTRISQFVCKLFNVLAFRAQAQVGTSQKFLFVGFVLARVEEEKSYANLKFAIAEVLGTLLIYLSRA